MRDFVEQGHEPCEAAVGAESPDDGSQPDRRVFGAWGAWLGALATNAEAALAAALAYKQLEGEGRDSWLAAVEQDVDRLRIPRIAAYAPLLAVESDPERRLRIANAIAEVDDGITPGSKVHGLAGYDQRGVRIAVVVAPLYLDFVQVLACCYRICDGFEWVRHEPILCRTAAPVESQILDGAALESIPMKLLIDELAHAVVAHNRARRPLPEALSFFAHLFDAQETSPAPHIDLR